MSVSCTNVIEKQKGLGTFNPSLRAASCLFDCISFRMLVREYCTALSSFSEGTPLLEQKYKPRVC